MIDRAILPPTLSGPSVSRWWGCFPDLRRDTLGFLIQCQAYGDVVKLPMGLVVELLLRQRDAAMYVLNHPADVKHVLVTNQDNYRKAPVPPVESRIFGQGVLHTEGEIHHRQRRVLLPFFHGNHVTAYTNLITSQARDRVALWQDDTTIDIGQEMAHLTLSVIWRLLFGQDLRSEGETIREAIAVGQSLIKLQYDSLLASVTPLWIPIPRHRRFTRGFRVIEERLFQFIHERRMAAAPHDDVLSLLLSATDTEGRPLSDEEIRDELMTFLLAGHETTANALTWTWFLLSQDRSVRERLTQELNEVLGARLPNAADLPRLRYMKMIWDESLRLYPPAWTLHTRLAHAQDRLPSGAILPPGAWVFISPWNLHRNPRWFADPNRFDPERFSDEAQQTCPAFTYIPFGAGGRRCLGESFAEMEGLLIIGDNRRHSSLTPGQRVDDPSGTGHDVTSACSGADDRSASRDLGTTPRCGVARSPTRLSCC
ncbi:MAG: cytochrome P450 [Nitrospira sp.]|nr:MAG: cytochrome P450 [Nitrospira sp.]